jgi:hypothetical protein
MSNGRVRRALDFAAVLVTLALADSAPVLADPIIDFQLAGSAGGTISYAGGASPLVGANIPIRLVSGFGTPLNNGATLGVYSGFSSGNPVGAGSLAFSTGSLVSYSGGVMTFGGNGSMTITGLIPGAGINTVQTLLLGSFIGGTYNVNTGGLSLFVGRGSDSKHPTLVSYYFPQGPPGWNFTGTVLATKPVLGINNAFQNVTPVSVDIANAAVPEVGSVLMLGTSLLATAFLIRRRAKFGF